MSGSSDSHRQTAETLIGMASKPPGELEVETREHTVGSLRDAVLDAYRGSSVTVMHSPLWQGEGMPCRHEVKMQITTPSTGLSESKISTTSEASSLRDAIRALLPWTRPLSVAR